MDREGRGSATSGESRRGSFPSGRRGSGVSGSSGSEVPRATGVIPSEHWTRGDLKDKTGKSGTPIPLVANFVKIEVNRALELHQYHVTFNPVIDSKPKRMEALQSLSGEIGDDFMFDGMIMYSSNENLEVKMVREVDMPGVPNVKVEVCISRTVTLTMNDPQFLTVANIIIRRVLEAEGMKQVGRAMFNPASKQMLEDYPIEIWPGYSTGTRMYEDEQILLCAENRHKLIRTDTVLEMMWREVRRSKQTDEDVEIYRNNVEAQLLGSTVVMLHNNKLHRIDEVAWNLTPDARFDREGGSISVAEYMMEQYNITIEEKSQPLLVSFPRAGRAGEARQNVYLVPELCHLTGLTEKMRNDRRLMRSLANLTRMKPEGRIALVNKFLQGYRETPNITKIMTQWGLSMADSPISFFGRVLPSEKIVCAGGGEADVQPGSGEWTQALGRRGPFRTVNIDDETWSIIYPNRCKELAFEFYDKCKELGNRMGIKIGRPIDQGIGSDSAEEYARMYQNMLAYAKSIKQTLKMVVCILPNDNKTRYDTLKKQFCIMSPVPSQMVRAETLEDKRKFHAVVLKILLQINCKMGGALWKVHIPLKRSIIVGYDLYHDSTQHGKTVGACVSSYDGEFTRWFGQCALHGDMQQLSSNLGDFVREAVLMFYKHNHELPDRVLIYRDGCGDGQIPHVLGYEVPQVDRAMKDVRRILAEQKGQGDVVFEPRVAFTVVSKKIDVRFFQDLGDGHSANPPFGTVVDNTITRPERFDFYLVPQAVNQGTVAPVNYHVIYDKSGLKPDQHQLLAYKLCHLYYNWQGTIRVPSPCQYAHKLAFLVAQSIHQSGDESLADKLYYL